MNIKTEVFILDLFSKKDRTIKKKKRGSVYKKTIGNPKGQVTAEYLLLAVVFIAFFGLITNTLKNNDYLKDFQDAPNAMFENMIENGNWEVNEAKSQKQHPNQHNLHFTSKGTN